MQPRNLSLGVAKQLGLDRPGEGRQARAGALCALACVIFARHLRKEVLKRMGRAGRERKEGKNSKAGPLVDHREDKVITHKAVTIHGFVLKSCLLLNAVSFGAISERSE